MKKTDFAAIGEKVLRDLGAREKANADLIATYEAKAEDYRQQLDVRKKQMDEAFTNPDTYQKLFTEVRKLETNIEACENAVTAIGSDPTQFGEIAWGKLDSAMKDATKAFKPLAEEFNSCLERLISLYKEIAEERETIQEWINNIYYRYCKGYGHSSPNFRSPDLDDDKYYIVGKYLKK